MISENDTRYMKLAISYAKRGIGMVNPNPLVGAVIVKENKIISTGYHMKYGEAHAEVNAFKNAGNEDVKGATMYVTLEPCSHYGKTPPCANRIVEEGIKRVVIGSLDINPVVSGRGAQVLKAAGIEVETGVLEEECNKVNEVFNKYIKTKKPFVIMKWAMSVDGKIATVKGESKWISSSESRRFVHKMRNKYSAIMVGIGTVLKDNPRLTCRIENGRNPIRIVVDSSLRMPIDSEIVKTARDIKTIVACTDKAAITDIKKIEDKGVNVICIDSGKDGKVDLQKLMTTLGEMGIDSILLEGGSALNFSALSENIVDKINVFVAPKIIGGDMAKGPVGSDGVTNLIECFNIKNLEFRKIGPDILIEGYIGE